MAPIAIPNTVHFVAGSFAFEKPACMNRALRSLLKEHMAQIKTAFGSQIESCSFSLLVGIVGLGS